MYQLEVPKMLKRGDTIALISISGGRAGDEDMLYRYETGKKRLEETWGVHVVTTPNALAGSKFLYEHPEARAEDLMWAMQNKEIKGIICMMGGDDSYRVLPYIDLDIIKNNPKVFMGYSDITSWMAVFAKAGVRAYYGPNLLTPVAQPVTLDNYTKEAITKCLFSAEVIGDIPACSEYTNIEWRNVDKNEIKWTNNTGYRLVQGNGVVRGRIFGGCAGPLRQIMGTEFFPKRDFFKDCIIMLETGLPYGGDLAGLHDLRALDAAGMFEHAAGMIIGQLSDEEEQVLIRFLKYEAHREDLPVISNVDFVHRTPMTVIPMGAVAEIDCSRVALRILESGVAE
ncbi:MAG TPA: LD-carboxypeptidase [Candidatus Eisenbergiella merdavium]|uniref:LD-carboxypeptidase n=1 Tax=Candidatus Eisenbergiella merdavium TaxID=2838551 RepID=A0A9D2NJT2_9FIRM|nr:LD-carboxypeptidase [Candidatus Eisenbergiella merdavium]